MGTPEQVCFSLVSAGSVGLIGLTWDVVQKRRPLPAVDNEPTSHGEEVARTREDEVSNEAIAAQLPPLSMKHF